jgi:hypothetical protein
MFLILLWDTRKKSKNQMMTYLLLNYTYFREQCLIDNNITSILNNGYFNWFINCKSKCLKKKEILFSEKNHHKNHSTLL